MKHYETSVRLTAKEYLAGLARMFEQVEVTSQGGVPLSLDEGVRAAVDTVLSLKEGTGKAMLIGNGGSAAIVSHMQNDFCKVVGVRAMVFSEPPLLMALANDHGFETIFERPVALWAEANDLLIAVSSSGESENVVKATRAGVAKGCRVLTFTGFNPANRLRQLGDVNIYVPFSSYGYVEMTHSIIGHCIVDMAMSRVAAAV